MKPTASASKGGPGDSKKGLKILVAVLLFALAAGLFARWYFAPKPGQGAGPATPPVDYRDTSKPRGGPAIAPGVK